MGDNSQVQFFLDPAASRAELEAVLASPSFVRAPTVSKILAYVCNQYFEGARDSVKEWSIAVDALGRRQTFDPEKDSIVRVEFHSLRKRLAEYYQKEGASHAVRITFAESGYVPRFVSAVPAKPAISENPPAPEVETSSSAVAGPVRLWQRSNWLKAATMPSVAILAFCALGLIGLRKAPQSQAAAVVTNSVPAPKAHAGGPSAEDGVRIAVGLPGPQYVDSSGRLWLGDPYFTGGMPFDRSDRKIFGTLDPEMYEKGREGEFRYDIPVKRGVYELRLHFAETRFGQTPIQGAEAMRRFDVSLNGRPILEDFDITRDAAGTDIATVKVWKDVVPAADGFIRLVFYGRSGRPLLNAIELLPGTPGKPLPVRIVCGMHPVYDKLGRFWQADAYFRGGRQSERLSVYEGTDDLALYASARFGNFSYAIPVVTGETYRAKLKFADFASRLPGDRLFDVFCNGVSLLTDFDILKRAGGRNHATEVTLRGLKPNAQGKLLFSFIPSRDYAAVQAIEIEADRQ
jgi:hypothetical protein